MEDSPCAEAARGESSLKRSFNFNHGGEHEKSK